MSIDAAGRTSAGRNPLYVGINGTTLTMAKWRAANVSHSAPATEDSAGVSDLLDDGGARRRYRPQRILARDRQAASVRRNISVLRHEEPPVGA